jgi:hypothetical protein
MMDIYGTDINSDFTFTNGDINLVSGTQNLGQAICNRLNSDLTTYDTFYPRYGGNLFEWFGEWNTPNIHEYIKIEIESILDQDPRIASVEATVNKNDNKTAGVTLEVTPVGSEEIVTLNLVIQEDLIVKLNTDGIDTDKIALGDRL